MTAQRLTDAQIAAALRAHLPAHARADVRVRIAAQVSTTNQLRPMPGFFALLSDADPAARRRALLLVAAALLAIGVVAAAVVGTLLRRNDVVRITTDPAVNAPAFVEEAFAAHRFLPPMTLVARLWDLKEGPVDVQRFYVNAAGHLRHECCDGTIMILAGDRSGSSFDDGSGKAIWVSGPQGAPNALPAHELAMYSGFGDPSCRAGSWRYVGPEVVLDRPAHHLACPLPAQGEVELPDLELWLDAELGLTLRSATWGIQMDENNEPLEPYGSAMEVESILFGEPDPALFEPPPGMTVMTQAELNCQFDPGSCATAGPPETPQPVTTPEASLPPGAPPDVPALVAATLQSYVAAPGAEIVIEDRAFFGGVLHQFIDSAGSKREERSDSVDDPNPPIITLWIPEGFYETWYLDDGTTEWRRLGDFRDPQSAEAFALGLPATCDRGWTYLGRDLLLGAAAWHIACGPAEFWIDQQRLLVLRTLVHRDALHVGEDVRTVLLVEIGPQPPELFRLPEDAVIAEGR
jgi:hypothetical protein